MAKHSSRCNNEYSVNCMSGGHSGDGGGAVMMMLELCTEEPLTRGWCMFHPLSHPNLGMQIILKWWPKCDIFYSSGVLI